MGRTWKFIATLGLLNLCGCSLDLLISKESASTGVPIAEVATFQKTEISQHSYTFAAVNRPYQLYKTQMGSQGTPTFMQWMPNVEEEMAGAVIIYYPYEGVDWTGLALDARWSRPDGFQNDEDGPFYNISTSSQIKYTAMNHATAATNHARLAYNKLHVLIVYGRFYSGVTPEDEVEVIEQAYKFLDQQPLVDKTKIGIYSGSWGGVGALYGSAKSAIKPKSIALAFPVGSPKELLAHIDSIPSKTADAVKRAEYLAYFDPYKRRIDKATEALAGQSTRYDAWTYNSLVSLSSSNIFIIHDNWDTLVPVAQSNALTQAVGFADQYKYYIPHTTAINYTTFPLNHYQPSEGLEYTTQLTWLHAFLIAELTDPTLDRTTEYNFAIMRDQFIHMKNMYDAGQDTSQFDKILTFLCRPHLVLADTSGANINGYSATLVTFLMNNFYQPGWSTTDVESCNKLITDTPFTP